MKRIAATHDVQLNEMLGHLEEVKLKATDLNDTVQHLADGLAGKSKTSQTLLVCTGLCIRLFPSKTACDFFCRNEHFCAGMEFEKIDRVDAIGFVQKSSKSEGLLRCFGRSKFPALEWHSVLFRNHKCRFWE